MTKFDPPQSYIKSLSRSFRKGTSFSGPVTLFKKYGLVIRRYDIARGDSLKGKKILFFSDLHYKGKYTRNFFGGPLKGWNDDSSELETILRTICAEHSPDILIFGGDLISYSCMLPKAEMLLKSLDAPLKLAVYGNWDKRRRKWFPFRVLEHMYESAGWHIMQNEGIRTGDIYLYGTDDYKMGIPEIYPDKKADGALFRILITHNPDAVPFMPLENLRSFDLALCGHTHAGQIRIPFFGALRTSSEHWKKFEYGSYRSDELNMDMLVSSGIGTTLIPLRIFCPPEVLLLRFV